MHCAEVYISCTELGQVCGSRVFINKANCKVIFKLLHKTFGFPSRERLAPDYLQLVFKQVQLKPHQLTPDMIFRVSSTRSGNCLQLLTPQKICSINPHVLHPNLQKSYRVSLSLLPLTATVIPQLPCHLTQIHSKCCCQNNLPYLLFRHPLAACSHFLFLFIGLR